MMKQVYQVNVLQNNRRNYLSTLLFVFLLFLGIKANAAIRTSTAAGGLWNAGATWVGGVKPEDSDDVIIATTGGNSVTLGGSTDIQNFTINSGAIFNDGNFNLTAFGNLTINGLYQGNGTGRLRWEAIAKTLDGAGIIDNINRLEVSEGSTKSILSTANITFTGTNQLISIGSSNAITNHGTVTLKTITGASSSTSRWINDIDAILNISESLFSTGSLTAIASGNTINYNGSIAQTIKATSYYHLKYTGSNTGTLGGNINIAGNFTVSSGTFAPSTRTTTFNGTANAQNIYGGGTFTFYNLALNNTFATIPQLIFNTSVTTSTLLTMTSGIVDLAGNTFTLGVSATPSTLTRTASTTTNWMYGGIFKRFWLNATTITSTSGNFYGLFPMGTVNASSYRSVELNSTGNITTAGFFTVNHIDAFSVTSLSPVYNDAGTNITRIHDAQFITAISGVTAGTFKISATMTGLPAGILSDIRLAVFTGGTTASAVGTHFGATGTAPNPTAARTGIITLTDLNNDFRISTTDIVETPLPIELLSFVAEWVSNSIVLKWTTATENSNDYFTLERSVNGIIWTIIGTVDGAGNSSTIRNYSFTDVEPYNGVSYYRLKQTDFNGQFEYADILTAVKNGDEGLPELIIYPNPSNGTFNLLFNGDKRQVYSIEIFNMFGGRVYHSNSYQSNIDFLDNHSGIYFVYFHLDTKTITKKIVVTAQ